MGTKESNCPRPPFQTRASIEETINVLRDAETVYKARGKKLDPGKFLDKMNGVESKPKQSGVDGGTLYKSKDGRLLERVDNFDAEDQALESPLALIDAIIHELRGMKGSIMSDCPGFDYAMSLDKLRGLSTTLVKALETVIPPVMKTYRVDFQHRVYIDSVCLGKQSASSTVVDARNVAEATRIANDLLERSGYRQVRIKRVRELF